MEKPNEIRSSMTLMEDPQYFGSYLNMARHNVLTISNHVAKKLGNGISILDDEEKIETSFLCDPANKKIPWNRAFEYTLRFMPIIKVFDYERLPKSERYLDRNTGKDIELMSNVLKDLFGQMNEFRNDYTHYYSTNQHNLRKRYITEELAFFLKTNHRRAIEYSKTRFHGVLTNEDFNAASAKILVEDDHKITQYGLVFLTTMFLEREQAFQFIGKITGLKGTQYQSFIATREVLMHFCIKRPHDRFVSEDTSHALILDIINELNKCPKILYEVITEEARKPFNPKLDKLSKINLLANSSNNQDEPIENYDEYIEALTRRVRYEDRFNDFALKFIDEKQLLPKWFFQIDLGKLEIDRYPKTLDGAQVERAIQVRPKAFGKLNELNNEELLLKRISPNDHSVHFDPFSPSYNYENNKIGLSQKRSNALLIQRIDPKRKVQKRLKQPQPEVFLSVHELPKIILLEYLKKGETEKRIDQFIELNNNSLFSKSFIEKVKTELPTEWNVFYRSSASRKKAAYNLRRLKYLHHRKLELNNILSQYQLNSKQVPAKILNYWLNIEHVKPEQALSDHIKKMKRDCMDRLKALKKHRKKEEGPVPKIGEMASFLAKDIVDMIISKEKKAKITSFYYEKMKECLALLNIPEKRQLLIQIISNELKLNEPGGHPFLKSINLSEMRYTIELYETYLTEKGHKLIQEYNYRTKKKVEIDQSWLAQFYSTEWNENAQKKLTAVKLPKDQRNIPLTLRNRLRPEPTLDIWLSHILNGKTNTDKPKPIDLPTNLFDEVLFQLLESEIQKYETNLCPRTNYNELFKSWWNLRGDSIQPFYEAQREYTIYDETFSFELNSQPRFANYFQEAMKRVYARKQAERTEQQKTNRRLPNISRKEVEQTFSHTVGHTEKQIRITQEHDRLLLLMLEQLLENGSSLNLKLKEAHQLLNKTVSIKQTVTGKRSFNAQGQRIKIGDRTTISKVITVDRKRKDATILHRFVFDKRIPELFEYYHDEIIQLDELQLQLQAYNKAKLIIIDKVFELEKKIIEADVQGLMKETIDKTTELPATGSIQHKPYILWLTKKSLLTNDESAFLLMTRNTFSHNQFPHRATADQVVTWNTNPWAMQIAETYTSIIDQIIKQI